MNKIVEALEQRFVEQRIIFWYDEKAEFLEQFKDLNLFDITKIHIEGNEFAVKYLTEKQHPYGKFLLYFSKPRPANEDNWLLDMELAHYIFRTDQEALFLQEIGLEYHFKELVSEHIEFFKAKERRQKLRELIDTDETHNAIRYKMLAVIFNTEYINLANYIFTLSAAFIDKNERFEKELERYQLKNFFWKEIERKYNYQAVSPSIYDFLIEVFGNNFSIGRRESLNREARLLLISWKDTLQFRESFEHISEKIANDLGVETLLSDAKIDDVIEDDVYKLIDFKILHELINQLINEEITHEKLSFYAKKRQNKFWYAQVKDLYSCVSEASELTTLIRKYATQIQYKTFEEGTTHYTQTIHEIDLHYRKFVWYYRKTNQNKVLGELSTKIERLYTNDWLVPYNNQWQNVVDSLAEWPNSLQFKQRRFFDNHVKPIIDKKQRLFVIISDAFRYECGVELNKRFQSEKRFESNITYGVSSLPSYTQLCMASLLPHKQLSIKENSDSVIADGMASSGLEGRNRILATNTDVRTTAISAEEFMSLNSSKEGRDLVKQYDLFYIYHNRIDKTGDDKITEEKVFDAVEEEMVFLAEMVRKIANMNGTNIIITADHGFIYQHSELKESDFSSSNHTGEIWKENRRFIIGKNIQSDTATKLFDGDALGLQPEIQVLIPKSINRIRVKGAGSRFVHGGASLQEVIFPIIKIRHNKEGAAVAVVEIDIIKSTDRITTNILAVSFIQSELVGEQILARDIRAGLYAEDGELLSDQFRYVFDIQEGSERQREVKHRFQISSKATTKYKNQRVKLILEEPVEGTTKWKPYKEFFYTLNISFTNDFD